MTRQSYNIMFAHDHRKKEHMNQSTITQKATKKETVVETQQLNKEETQKL